MDSTVDSKREVGSMLRQVAVVMTVVGIAVFSVVVPVMAFVPPKTVPECVTITPGEQPIVGNGEVCNTSGTAPPPVVSHPGQG